jgi:LPPG:FO 2-phospho-L-lactate transferase
MNGVIVVALAGGVGGAKLADGLAQVLNPEDLTIIVNTADDFTHLGLKISPDLDTVCYTLAGKANPVAGWGRIDETWNVFTSLREMGMPDWFQLGDSDLATHIVRTDRLSHGWMLSQITSDFCRTWGIKIRVLPMTDSSVQTWFDTNEGEMEFQEYFVHRKCEPVIKQIKFSGIEQSVPSPGCIPAINDADAIVICPSNPWVSIDPILAIPHIRSALQGHIVIAISPLIGDQAVKGPAAKMFTEFGIIPSAFSVAQHYGSVINGIFIDTLDEGMGGAIQSLGLRVGISEVLMKDQSDRGRLAREIIECIKGWRR